MAEQTLIIIKPDGLQRRLVGEIVGRFEKKGLKIVAVKLMKMTVRMAKQHYTMHKDQYFFDKLIRYITSGPVLVIVLEGKKVIQVVRKMMGITLGFDAEAGTIRGDFSTCQTWNLVHGSDSAKSAKKEIRFFFKPGEILKYEMTDEIWL
ncbi:MAG: nucleoside-diphosphate kinase [Sedimentisphaerales bacterium]